MATKPIDPGAIVKDLSNQFIDDALGLPHSLMLEALLNTYVAVAKTHTCCTQGAANATMKASILLAQHAATHPQHPHH